MTENTYKRGDFCDEAKETITEKRTNYGKPENNFKHIAEQWSLFLRQKYEIDVQLTPADIAVMMADLKKCRNLNEYKRDNIVDAIGYIALQGELQEDKPKKAPFKDWCGNDVYDGSGIEDIYGAKGRVYKDKIGEWWVSFKKYPDMKRLEDIISEKYKGIVLA